MTEVNYVYHRTDGGVPVKSWTKGVPLEPPALQQLHHIAALPFIHKHVAAMPDVHWGLGATVGSVIPTKGAIIPAAVGVDIGCGMAAVQTSLTSHQLPDSLKELRARIEALVPVGRASFKDDDLPRESDRAWSRLFKRAYERMQEKHPAVAIKKSPALQLGTLGGGNHFIEVCLDETDRVWLMLHTGSRGVGNRIGSFFIAEAKREMERYFISLPDKNLAYLSEAGTLFDDYVEAVGWAQDYARTNREVMLARLGQALRETVTEFEITGEAVNCHHNYVELEHHFGANVWVTRKGAVRARVGDTGIIPGSMGARSYIVRGKGNADSFDSCSHGAGRAMGRREAARRFSLEDHARATAGVECRKDAGVLDETPGAYKNIDAVMAAQADLVEVVHTLKQVVCVKG